MSRVLLAPRSGISPWGSGSRHGPDEERQPTARTYDAVTRAQAQRVGSDRRRKERGHPTRARGWVMTRAVDTTRTRAELRRFCGWIGSIVHGIWSAIVFFFFSPKFLSINQPFVFCGLDLMCCCGLRPILLQGSGSRPHGQWRPRRRDTHTAREAGKGKGDAQRRAVLERLRARARVSVAAHGLVYLCCCAPGTTSPSCTHCDVVKPSNVLLDTVTGRRASGTSGRRACWAWASV